MDPQLAQQITGILESRGGQATLRDIQHEVRGNYQKKDLNRCLYALQSNGAVRKMNDVPPTWSLTGGGRVYEGQVPGGARRPPRGGRGRSYTRQRPHMQIQPYPPPPPPPRPPPPHISPSYGQHADRDLETRILQTLSNHNQMTALELTKLFRLPNRKPVNQALYRMEKNGLAMYTKPPQSAPIWSLVANAPSMMHSTSPSQYSPSPSQYSPSPSPSSSKYSGQQPSSSKYSGQQLQLTGLPPPPGFNMGSTYDRSQLRDQVLHILEQSSQPLSVAELGEELRCEDMTMLSQVLLALQQELQVKRVDDNGQQKWQKSTEPSPSVADMSGGSSQSTPLSEFDTMDTGEAADPEIQQALTGIPEDNVFDRVMAVLSAKPDDLFADSQLAAMIGGKRERSEVGSCLGHLEKEGQVARTKGRFPILWGLPSNPEFQQQLEQVNPCMHIPYTVDSF